MPLQQPTIALELTNVTLPSETFTHAGFGRRIIAVVIDLPFVAVVLALLVVLLAIPWGLLAYVASITEESSRRVSQALGMVIFFLGPLVYFAGLESSRWQATIGKRALGLRVVTMSLERISLPVACRRSLAKWLSLFPSGAGLLLALIRPNGQAFHDSVTGTLVVRAR
jgi:uncharacterized RDD family membrane protein YckC